VESASEEDVALAHELLAKWDYGRGISKSQLEIKTWGDATSHGRRFDRFIANTLGVSTTRPSRQTDRIAELEQQIRSLGRQPVGHEPDGWEVQLDHARASCLEALRVWNDPTSGFRTGAFSMLFVAAWNSVAIAILQRDGGEWRALDEDGEVVRVHGGVERARETGELVGAALPGADRVGLRQNVDFWIELRNAVAHRFLPALDVMVIPHAQAGLLNFEDVLRDRFGPAFGLADSLSVPLQLSGFRDPGVLTSRKGLFAALPIEVQAVLSRADSAPPELLSDPTFMLRVAFIPAVPASGRNPDAVAYFVRPGEVPDELAESLERYVVVPKPRQSVAQFRPKHVCAEVSRRTGFVFHYNHHAPAARKLGAWPAVGEPDATIDEYLAEYNSAFKGWLYSQRWIDLVVESVSDPDAFLAVTGHRPVRLQGDAPPD
jgi:hypothetical protein